MLFAAAPQEIHLGQKTTPAVANFRGKVAPP
jgi:hypothetical protein